MNYYNENDPKAAAWIRKLIAAGLVPDGEVDERSITDVKPDDVRGFIQCHWFAGILGWSLALKLAGWPEDKPIWTGSCPCPPFSAAGKKKNCPKCGDKPIPHPLKTGTFACIECGYEWIADTRHLWPEFRRLIQGARPAIVIGEQVAGADGVIWFTGVRATLEALGYGVGAADLCAAGVGSPHIRQRLYWMAYSGHKSTGWSPRSRKEESRRTLSNTPRCSNPGGVADVQQQGLEGQPGNGNDGSESRRIDKNPSGSTSESGGVGGVANSNGGNSSQGPEQRSGEHGQQQEDGGDDSIKGMGDTKSGRCGEFRNEAQQSSGGYIERTGWSRFELVHCRDGKARRIEPGTWPLVAGLPRGMVPSGDPSVAYAQATAEARTARLRGYGNSIVPQVAAEFIIAAMEAISALHHQ